jgi:hypothetical protein
MKKCIKCNIEKEYSEFYIRKKGSKDGYRKDCKKCNIQHSGEYYKNNKEKVDEYGRKWRIDNLERSRETSKLAMRKKRENPISKLNHSISSLIRMGFKSTRFDKKSRTQDILGCSYDEFRVYLESKFQSWMTWENRGKYNGELNYGWDMDHIIPLSSAKTEEDVIRLNHYSNLQPLCSKVNRDIKKAKTDFM